MHQLYSYLYFAKIQENTVKERWMLSIVTSLNTTTEPCCYSRQYCLYDTVANLRGTERDGELLGMQVT